MTGVKAEERVGTSQPAGDQGTLEVAIRSTEGERVTFKVKPTTKVEKIISTYCVRKKIDRKAHRFFFDGQALEDTQDMAVREVGMENGDHIDCMYNQAGGAPAQAAQF